jgi:hypothetical protein
MDLVTGDSDERVYIFKISKLEVFDAVRVSPFSISECWKNRKIDFHDQRCWFDCLWSHKAIPDKNIAHIINRWGVDLSRRNGAFPGL